MGDVTGSGPQGAASDTPGGVVSADFVFGTLATDDLRIARLQTAAHGVRHANDIEPLDPVPGAPVRIRVTVGPDVNPDRVTCYWTIDGREPDGHRGRPTVGSALELRRDGVIWDTLAWAYLEIWSGTIPAQPAGTLVRYRIGAWTADGRVDVWADDGGTRPGGSSERVGGGRYAYHVDDEHVPEWLRDAVIYQVFVDRFATEGGRPMAEPATPSGFFGGTLRGVRERLDHIASTGASCLWLSPVFPSPSHHGYDATDYRSVEPRLGTLEDLRDLIADAHARGLRVILDYVVNHVSSAHPAFIRATSEPASPEARWFLFDRWPDEYQTFFGVRDHPRIDSDDPGARDCMIDSALHWLDVGVDGFRCDYANGPSHAFWSAFRAATRRADPRSVSIGEVVETPQLLRTYRGRLDGCLDFILMQALRRFFAFGDLTASELDGFLRRHLAYGAGDFVLPSFLDNHDMNRFLWVVRGDVRRLRLAALCQFALPGPPIVYYGTEVGLSQERDVRYADGSGHPEESRLPMRWRSDQDAGLLAFYGRLARVRRDRPALWRAPRETVAIDDARGRYAWRCGDAEVRALVVLNNGPETWRLPLDPTDGWVVAVVTEDVLEHAADAVILPPYAGAILEASGLSNGPRVESRVTGDGSPGRSRGTSGARR
jgi:glycosidase